MQYKCKKCGANFDIPDDRIRPEGSAFKCNNCGTGFRLTRPGAQAAPQGLPLPPGAVACPKCGGINGSLARFCTHCGNPLSQVPHYAGGQRSQKTSLAIIIVIIVGVVFVGIAILGMLAAIAIPAFVGQREKARMRALEANYMVAVSVVRDELMKCAADPSLVTDDVVAELNDSANTLNPWFPNTPPFAPSFGKGQVSINRPDLRSLCGTTGEVVIMADDGGDGIVDEDFITSVRASDARGSSFDLPPDGRGGGPERSTGMAI